MRYQRLDLNLLTALRALLTDKSVTRASETMHLSQSAMSGVLARLREFFEDPLIVPVGRRSELTPLGESLVGPVNDVLMRIDATLTSRPRFDPSTSRRHFSIVASDYVTTVLLLDVLRSIEREAPGVRIELRQSSRDAVLELESGEVDFVINPQRYQAHAQSCAVLFTDTFCAVADAGNRDVGERIDFDRFVKARHVQFRNSGRPFFEDWFGQAHGDVLTVDVTAGSFHLLPYLVLGTSRIATMHSRLAVALARTMPLRLVPLDFEFPNLVEVLQWHRYRDDDPGNRWLRQLIVNASSRLMAGESALSTLR